MYEPFTLASLQRSIQRYSKDNNSNTNVLKDHTRVLKVKGSPFSSQARLSSQQRQEKSSTGCPRDEEDLMFQTGQFGEDDPEVLQRTVYWVLFIHFGFRARDESRRLQWGDIAVENEPVTVMESRSCWCGEQNEDRKQGKETAIAEHLIPKPTPPKTSTVQFVCV